MSSPPTTRRTRRSRRTNDFVSAPFGITGLETALLSLYHHFIATGKFGWDLIVKRYSAEPRRMLGLPPVPVIEGGAAEFIVFNPEGGHDVHPRVHEIEEREHAVPRQDAAGTGGDAWCSVGNCC